MKNKNRNYVVSMLILCTMFFVFGFVSWVNSILIPYFRIACELTHFQSYFVTFAFYIAYFIMAVPSGILLKKVGFKVGIEIGFMLMALGMFVFTPAALTRQFSLFLIGLFVIGIGLAILQTAANPFVTIVGPIESAVKRISICGICNKFAGIISPLLFAAVMLKASDAETFKLIESGALVGAAKEAALAELIQRVIVPYLLLGVVLLVFGILIRHSVLPEIDTEQQNASHDANDNHRGVFSYPYLVLGVVALFCHVGTQVVAIDTIISYSGTMGIDLIDAKIFPSLTLAFTLIGYCIGIVTIPRFLSQRTALVICTLVGLVLSVCVVAIDVPMDYFGHRVSSSLVFLNLMGLPNSLIYAGIWPLSIHGLGSNTKLGSSLLIMALCGNALMPQIYSLVATQMDSLRLGYIILIPCFLYMVFFAIKGYKINRW